MVVFIELMEASSKRTLMCMGSVLVSEVGVVVSGEGTLVELE